MYNQVALVAPVRKSQFTLNKKYDNDNDNDVDGDNYGNNMWVKRLYIL